MAQEGVNLSPQDSALLNTLGVAQYRVKQFAAALDTLERSNAINSKTRGKEHPGDFAFLAMTCHQLNKMAEAEIYFQKLQDAMKKRRTARTKSTGGSSKKQKH